MSKEQGDKKTVRQRETRGWKNREKKRFISAGVQRISNLRAVYETVYLYEPACSS